MVNFRTSAQRVAEGAARNDKRDGPETKYKLKIRARVPLADAGQSYSVPVKGRATKREIVKALEAEGYAVERVEKATGFGFYW